MRKLLLGFLIFSASQSFPLTVDGKENQLPGSVEVDYYPKTDYLDDYLNQMPWHYYGKYTVPELGTFFVDNANDVVKSIVKSGQIWEPYILNTIKSYVKPGDNVIDIGAHMGSITMACSNFVGPNGTVHSFEAERQFFRELYFNIKANGRTNIKPYLAWIGNENKVIDVQWYYGPEYSPVRSHNDQPYPLNVCTLDSFGLKNIALMKIDVECTEDSVIDGGYQTIMESRPVLVIEIMGGFGYNPSEETVRRINHTISKLNAMNYVVTKIWTDDYLAIPIERIP